MATISVFEHKSISLSGDEMPVRDVHLRQLERLNRQAGVDLVKLGYKQLRATAYVGVIQLGSVTLQILPKVDIYGQDDGQSEQSVESAVANLLWMLVYAGELPLHHNEISSLLKKRGDLFEILVRIFCQRLMEQLERGLHRTYRQQEDTLSVLKGRWLLSKQLRTQPLLRDKFTVAYDEFIADNPLNRIFCYTVHYLQRLSRDAHNRQRLDMLRMWLDEVILLPRVTPQDIERVTFTRLNAHYRPIFNLACMFLAQESLQLHTGQTEAFTFVFDMNQLFERFVAGFLYRHRDIAWPDSVAGCDLITQGRGERRWLARKAHNNKPVFQLKPDILFRRPDKTAVLIVDTKYKTKPNISEADAYQMHAYATRYHCPEVLLLYPEAQMSAQKLFIDNETGQSPTCLRTRTVSLRYDLGKPDERRRLAIELAQALEGD